MSRRLSSIVPLPPAQGPPSSSIRLLPLTRILHCRGRQLRCRLTPLAACREPGSAPQDWVRCLRRPACSCGWRPRAGVSNSSLPRPAVLKPEGLSHSRHGEGFSVAMSRGLILSPEKMDRQRDCKIMKKIMNSACFYSPTAASDRHFYHASVNELHKIVRTYPILQEGLFAKQIVGIFKCHWLKSMDITSCINN